MFVHPIRRAHRVPGTMPSAGLGSGNTKTRERQPSPEVASASGEHSNGHGGSTAGGQGGVRERHAA